MARRGGGATLALEDPSDGSELARIARGGAADVDAAVAAARAALDSGDAGSWGRLSARRARPRPAVDRPEGARQRRAARPSSRCTTSASRSSRRAPMRSRWPATASSTAAPPTRCTARRCPSPHGYTALTLREPHGVTGHIVPWNYPMQIVGRSVGAALAMGNACVLKPAEEACLTVLAFARIGAEAGLPAGALNVVTGPRRRSRRRARRASRHRPPLLHRLGRDRRAGADRGGEERRAGDARARRQEPADRLRRRRSRRGAAVPGQRRHPERGADLLGGVAHPGRAAGVRARPRDDGRALPGAARRTGGATTSTSAR